MLAYSGWGNMVPIVLTFKSPTYPHFPDQILEPTASYGENNYIYSDSKKNYKSKVKQFYLYGTCKLAIPICLGF